MDDPEQTEWMLDEIDRKELTAKLRRQEIELRAMARVIIRQYERINALKTQLRASRPSFLTRITTFLKAISRSEEGKADE